MDCIVLPSPICSTTSMTQHNINDNGSSSGSRKG